jgi:hypothetical protein
MEYRINWEIYTPYASTAGLHTNGKFTMRKLKLSLLSKRCETYLALSVASFTSSSVRSNYLLKIKLIKWNIIELFSERA